MKIHGIQLQEGSNVANLTVASGTSFPGSPNDAEMFYRTDSDTSIRGLYVYIGGSWDRIASADAITAPSAASFPSQSNVGDLFYKNSNDSFEGLYVYDGSTWIPAASGSGSTLTVTGDVTGTLTVGSSGALTLASVISATTVGAANQTLSITVNAKGLVTAASSQAIAISATQLTSGVLADSRVQQSNVTQYQAALSLSATQLTSGVLADARVQQSNVTQHQAALTIVETQITDGALLARNAGNETITGSWQFNNPLIVGTPSSGSHATTKDYVDTAIAGLSWKNSVVAASTVNLTLSGTQTIDGVSVNVGQRVLVKNQSTASQNGVYVVASGAWTRATDFDQTAPIDEVNSAAVFVQGGTLQADTAWTQVSPVTTVGTDAMTFSQFAGSNTYFAGTGMSLTGNTFNVGTASTARIVVNADDIDLALLGTPVSASFVKLTTDAYGRVSATTPVVVGDITGILSYTGDVSTSGTTATLATVNGNVGQFTAITVNAKGLATAATNLALTGDITGTASGASLATTLATVNGNVGTFNTLTVNAKGLVTAASNTSYQPLDADLTAIAAFSSTGFAVRTATDTWAQRSFTSTGSTITITNPAGIAGNVNLDLPAVGTPVSASFVKITTDTQGRVSATTPVVAGDITALVDATYVNVTGDTMAGALTISTNGAASQLNLQTTSTAGYAYQRFNDSSAVRKLEVLYVGSTVSVPAYGSTVNSAVINTSTGVDLNFSTADTLRMTVQAAGTILMNATTNAAGGTTTLVVGHAGSNTSAMIVGDQTTVASGTGVYLRSTTSGSITVGSGAFMNFLINTTEAMRISSAGNVGIGTTNPTFQFDLQGTGGAPMALTRYNNSASSTSISLLHSRGATVGTNTIVQSGDIFGSIIFGGANGTGYDSGAMIRAEVDGTPGASADMPGRLLFHTTPDGSATLTERMRIDSNGFVNIGTTSEVTYSKGLASDLAVSKSQVWTTASFKSYTASANGGGLIVLGKSRSATIGTQSVTSQDDILGYLIAEGVNSSSAARWGAAIQFAQDASAGATFLPGRIVLMTGTNAADVVERVRIDSVGNMGIGVTPSTRLHVSGTLTIASGGGTFFSMSGTVDAANYGVFKTAAGAALGYIGGGAGAAISGGTASDFVLRGAAANLILSAAGGTNDLTINSSGALGVGVAPSAWSTAQKTIDLNTAGAIRGSTTGVSVECNTYYDGTNFRAKTTGAGGEFAVDAGTHYWFNAVSVSAGSIQAMTERMRLSTGGELLIGMTSTGNGRMAVDGTAASVNTAIWGKNSGGASTATEVLWNATAAGDSRFIEFYTETSATLRGNIDFNRAGTAVRYNTSSDARLKMNIVDAPSAGALLDAVQVRSFDWKDSASHTEHGFVAQELVQVVPDAVSEGDTGEVIEKAWAVDYSKLVPLLVKEIQELRARVAALEAKA